MRALALALTLTFALPGLAPPLAAQDAAGSADHPLIPRYEGARIERYDIDAFNEYVLRTGPLLADAGGGATLEGRLTRITYVLPPERAALEVFRNYERALEAAGFEPLFACAERACGDVERTVRSGNLYIWIGGAEPRYLAARLRRDEGDAYAALWVVRSDRGDIPGQPVVQLDVVEIAPMEDRMAVLDAPAMSRELGLAGKAVLYGLQFDFDRDVLRPESDPQLEEIARLMRESPELRVLVVGHTDGVGAPDYNLDLSRRRAANVVAALVRDHGIAADRLVAVGVGMAAPVAPNATEAGKALNRRVELVPR